MQVAVLGARGFLGAAIVNRLRAAGHTVFEGVSAAPQGPQQFALDFRQLRTPADWLDRLPRVDVVINGVGLLRERQGATFAQLHEQAPQALVQACIQAGIPRFIQISALGADVHGCSAYFRSKGRFEAYLQQTALDWAIVRPSIVVGGASTQLFRRLASWPVLALPAGGSSQLQPVALDDVCELVLRLVERDRPLRVSVDAVGPRPLSLRDWLQGLRAGQGQAEAPVVALPWPLVGAVARLAACIPGSLLDSATLRMLRRGNCASPATMTAWLGRPPAESLAATAQPLLVHRYQLWQVRGLLRGALACVWLVTAAVSFGLYPVDGSLALLRDMGLHGPLAWTALLGGASADLLLGLLTLHNPLGRRLWQLQLALIGVYTLLISLWLPHWWLHPFGPVLKNVPLMAALLILLLTEDRQHA